MEDCMDTKLFRPLIVACACTAALAGAACDNTTNRQTSSAAVTPADTSANNNQSVTLTGCLLRGDGRNDFILTKANQPVGTSGAASGAGSVEQKTIDAASRSYRLNGDNDELDKLVGHQIRVSGTLADRGNLNPPQQGSSAERGTSGTTNKDRELSESDLAKMDVKSVESIADSCDSGKNGGASPSRR